MILVDWSRVVEWAYLIASDEGLEFAGRYVSTGLILLGRVLGFGDGDEDGHGENGICGFILRLKLLGHSLGGQLAGYVAVLITRTYSGCKVSLILAMDLAGYLFDPPTTTRPFLTFHAGFEVIVLHASVETFPFPEPGTQLGSDFLSGHLDLYLKGAKIFPNAGEGRRHSHSRVLNIALNAFEDGITIEGYYGDASRQNSWYHPGYAGATTFNLRGKLLNKVKTTPDPKKIPYYVHIITDRASEDFGKPVTRSTHKDFLVPPHKNIQTHVPLEKPHNAGTWHRIKYAFRGSPTVGP